MKSPWESIQLGLFLGFTNETLISFREIVPFFIPQKQHTETSQSIKTRILPSHLTKNTYHIHNIRINPELNPDPVPILAQPSLVLKIQRIRTHRIHLAPLKDVKPVCKPQRVERKEAREAVDLIDAKRFLDVLIGEFGRGSRGVCDLRIVD
eukprot:Sdes_comp12952_c0_seq1m3032